MLQETGCFLLRGIPPKLILLFDLDEFLSPIESLFTSSSGKPQW